MLKKLKIHLSFICTATNGLVLFLIIIISLIYIEDGYEKRTNALFKNNIDAISSKILSSNYINNSWLAQMESNNKLIIYIEDNTKPLFFKGAWNPKTNRHNLINKIKELSLSDGIDASIYPLSNSITSSSIFSIKGNKKEPYIGSLAIIPSLYGWQTLIVIKDIQQEHNFIIYQRIIFFLIALLGLISLFTVSWWFVGKALKPIAENQKKQSQFIACASHELRSPLAVIKTNISALKINHLFSDKFTDTIENECSRMARLIDDLLILASSDNKTWSVLKKPIDTDTLLIEIYETFEPLANSKGLNLFLNLPDYDIPKIYGDKQRIEQIFSILLNNAISYTPSGGTINISVEIKYSLIQIIVSDNGIGISKADKEYIFDRFYTIDKSRNDKTHFGLGLSVAKELINLHNGKIYVTDTKNGGSTFITEFPIKNKK